jgi:hypothetical protein
LFHAVQRIHSNEEYKTTSQDDMAIDERMPSPKKEAVAVAKLLLSGQAERHL